MELENGYTIHLSEADESADVYALFTQAPAAFAADTTHVTEKNVLGWLLTTEPNTASRMFSVRDAQDKLVAVITLNNIHLTRQSACVGVACVDNKSPHYKLSLWMSQFVVRYAFSTLNLNRLYAYTWGSNTRMRKLFELGGATLEGTERQHSFLNGEWADRQVWGLLRSEYVGDGVQWKRKQKTGETDG